MPSTSRGAPYPAASSGNNVPADLAALAGWVNDRPGLATLTTTQRNNLAGVELWEGRHIYNTTTHRLEYYDGDSWEPIPEPGRILGVKVYAPSPAGQLFTSSSVLVDVDGNLSVTFTAPATGQVWIELEGYLNTISVTTVGTLVRWGLREGSSPINGIGSVVENVGAPVYGRRHLTIFKGGLTPGQNYTYKWAHSVSAGATTALNVDTANAAIMRVIEA